MSKQANRTIIGGFVIGAVLLLVAGVLIFGSGRFLKERHIFVMYFEGSVKGLDVGASVDFRGVNIGMVTDIVLRANPEKSELEIPVFVDIDPERVENVSDGRRTRENVESTMLLLVERGLRAQLQMQSLVTGKLIVGLDFHPDKPIRLVGSDKSYPEIPTVQSDLRKIANRLEKVPIEEIFKKLDSTIEAIGKVANSPEIIHAIQSLNKALDAFQVMVRNIDRHVDPIGNGLEMAIRDAQNLVQNVDKQVQPLASGAEAAIQAAASAVARAEQTLATIDHTTGEGSGTIYEFNQTLRELAAASRAIRLLADYLSQHPESLVFGKDGSDE